MPFKNLRRRLALAVLAVSLGFAQSVPQYVFAGSPPVVRPTEVSRVMTPFELGNAHYKRGEYARAIEAYSEAIRVDPANPSLYDARGTAYAMLGKADLAAADYARQIELSTRRTVDGKVDASALVLAKAQPEAPPPPVTPTTPSTSPTAPPPATTQAPPGGATFNPFTFGGTTGGGAGNVSGAGTSGGSTSGSTSSGAPATSISGAAAQASGARTTGELLTNAPSVEVRRTSAINLDPVVRGYRSSQLNASANGVTQMKTRVDIDALFSNIDPGIVRNIRVENGPYTSLWGPGFAFLIADLQPSYRSENGYETHGSTFMSIDTNGQNFYTRQNIMGGSRDWGFYTSYGVRTGNDYSPGNNSFDFRIPASYNQWDGFIALGADFTARSRVEFNYVRNEKNNVELPGVIYDIVQSKDEQFNIRYVMQEDKKKGPENVVVQYWWTRTPYEGNSFRAAKHTTFYDQFITNQFFGFVAPNNIFNLSNTLAQGYLQTSGFRSLMTYGEAQAAQLTFGLDWRRYTQFYQESHIDFTGTASSIIFGRNDEPFGIPRSSMEDGGLFTNLSIPFMDELVTVSFGGRLDHTRAFVGDNADNPITRGGTAAGTGKPNETLGMVYSTVKLKLTEGTSLNGGIGFAQRQPNLSELYSDSPFVPISRQGNNIITGNSELNPESDLQFDLGLTGNWGDKKEWGASGRVNAGVRAFYANIDNYILYRLDSLTPVSVPAPPPAAINSNPFASHSFTYTNIDRATLWGGDLFGQYRIYKWLALTGTMAYVKGTNHDPQRQFDAAGNPVPKTSEGLPGIYPFNTTVGILISEPTKNRWGIEFSTRMVNGQNYVADSLLEAPTPGFTVCDLKGFWVVKERQENRGVGVRLTSGIDNLFDRTYTEPNSLVLVNPAGGYSFIKQPGINLRFGLEVEY